ncbi:MAG TPA: flagellar biosynthesis protein FlhB [Bacillota bacterium]|nr:flagellar biosynthesis protein FlhB [Bacillota bacterium]
MHVILDLQFFAGEKTEKATPKKREESRQKGQVAKSQDVNTAILLLFSFIVLAAFGSYMGQHMRHLYESSFNEYIHWSVTPETVMTVFKESVILMGLIVAPIMIIAIIAGFASNLMQVGFLFTTEPLKFDLKKIDPIKGAKRIFSIRALVELVKSMLKILFIGSITFFVIWINKDEMMMLALKSIDSAIAFFGRVTIIMGVSATLALVVLAIIDYLYQRYDHEKNIRMSKQDIKDEHKNIEGDPLIKSKLKEKQRQIAMQRMMSEVPEADVVITNPTHFAVAIKYDEEKATAPYVIAKGTDLVALKIKEIAKAHNVMTVENKQLARSLHATLEINDVIPEQFYQAVAEILAYVYQVERNVR